MRPILYNANETAFETYGLGEIDATKAQVTRERNGNYTLYIEYPASGPLAGTFKNDMRIKSDAGLRTKNQTFFISRILKDSSGILKVYAKHISHLTEKMAIRNNTNATGTAQAALAIWALNALGGIRFDTWSDIDLTSKTSWNIADFKTARDALGGVKGSIIDVWGGEYEFDNTVIRLHKQLGRKSPTVLEYGRNILRAEDDQDIEGAYTSVYPYATYTPENQGTGEGGATSQQVTVELPEKYVDGPYIGLYNERRVLIVDFSSNFKDKEVPTIDKLRRLAKEYAINNRLGLPKINTKIEYVDLSKTLDYKLTQILEEAELCDIVPVYYPQIGLTSEDAKLTTIVYDVLLEQNDSVEVGVIGDGFKSSMTSNLSGKIDDLANNQQRLVNTLPDYLLNAQGNKVWYNRPDNKEHKIGDIWFEKNGLYDRMYVWNGSQWEKRIDTEDIDKVKKEVDRKISDAQISTNQAIAQANAKAEEALKKAGTLPDTSKLSDQIKQQILSSPDLSRKVAENLEQTDSGVIYNKIYQNIQKQFVSKSIGDFLMGEHDRMRDYQSYLDSKIERQTIEFNKLTESNKLYERILGTSETDAPDQLSRLVMSSEIFQTEVGKYVTDDNNLIVNSMTMDKNTLVGNNNPKASVSVNDGIFTIKAQGLTGYNWTGFSLPIYVKKVYHGETYTLGFKYRIREYPDVSFAFNIKNHGLNKTLTWANIGENRPPLNEWQEFQKTFSIQEDFAFGEDVNYPFYICLSKNGWIEFKEPILVRGSNTGPYKPSQFDDAYKASKEAKDIASDAQTKAIQVAEQARQAQQMAEATRTQVTQLAGSWSVRNLNSAGDVLGQLNLNPDGSVKINEALVAIGEKTYIKNGVIKDGMIANLNADKITGGTIDASQVNVINVNAGNVLAGTLTGMTVRGGRIEGLNGKMYIDLQNSQYNVLNNEATIRRIDDTNSSQFIKLTKSGFIAERFRDSNAALMVLGTNHNKDPKEVERHDNETFAGIRLWSGKGNGTEESLTEFVGDRVLIYNNGRYRSPWNFHGNTNDGNAYLIPMNQNNVKHYIGRGDFFLEGIYSKHFYMSGGRDIGQYLWDLLTCFGIMKRYGQISGAAGGHVQGVLDKYGFK
nr:MAG TPA: tail protein [Caudoviricetes sp.]